MPDPIPVFHIAFYRFVPLADPAAVAERLRDWTRALTGSILVATEGINGVLAGEGARLDDFEALMQRDDAFSGMTFRRTACVTVPFARMKVHVRPEIVAVGVTQPPAAKAGTSVSPEAWRELLKRDDVVVLDNRNHFEYRLGRFRGAVDPGVESFRDFPAFVEARADEWKAQGKRVAMYCTGGIRCEKTSGWMSGLGLDVVQLEGGILNYFERLPDADRDWLGECFVFDNRIALDTHLQETGTGLDEVYDTAADAWRLARAKRLHDAS